MQYLCKAGQQVRAKAQDSAPDKDRMPLLGAPSLAGQASTGSANAAGWLSTESGQLTLLCLLYQQGLGRSDYWTSTTFQEPSTDIGYKKKKRLAKSGKDTIQKVVSCCIFQGTVFWTFTRLKYRVYPPANDIYPPEKRKRRAPFVYPPWFVSSQTVSSLISFESIFYAVPVHSDHLCYPPVSQRLAVLTGSMP